MRLGGHTDLEIDPIAYFYQNHLFFVCLRIKQSVHEMPQCSFSLDYSMESNYFPFDSQLIDFGHSVQMF